MTKCCFFHLVFQTKYSEGHPTREGDDMTTTFSRVIWRPRGTKHQLPDGEVEMTPIDTQYEWGKCQSTCVTRHWAQDAARLERSRSPATYVTKHWVAQDEARLERSHSPATCVTRHRARVVLSASSTKGECYFPSNIEIQKTLLVLFCRT